MTILMSFWPSVFQNISNQTKILEYRRTFPKECSTIYMYVSKPIKSICGIVELGNKYSLEDWKNQYSNCPDIIYRINAYNPSYKYAMEIKTFQKIEPITLENLRIAIPEFVAPQSYIILDNKPKLMDYILQNTFLLSGKIENKFTNVYPEHICMRY